MQKILGENIMKLLPISCKSKVRYRRVKAVSELHLTATGNHMPYGITVSPATAEAGTRFIDTEGMQG